MAAYITNQEHKKVLEDMAENCEKIAQNCEQLVKKQSPQSH